MGALKAETTEEAECVGDYVSYVLALMHMRFANVNLDYAIYREIDFAMWPKARGCPRTLILYSLGV